MPKSRGAWGPWEALGVGLLAYVASLFFTIIVALSYTLIVGREVAQIEFSENLGLNLGFMLVNSVGMLLVVAGFLAIKKSKFSELGIRAGKLKRYWTIPAGLIVYWGILIASFTTLEAVFPALDLNQNQDIVFKSADGTPELLIAFVALVIVAPISEELVYRGFVFQGLSNRFHPIWAALVSSILFGLVHGQLNVFIDTFILGMVLCWLFVKTKSIWPPIILHAIKNGVAFYLLFFVGL